MKFDPINIQLNKELQNAIFPILLKNRQSVQFINLLIFLPDFWTHTDVDWTKLFKKQKSIEGEFSEVCKTATKR